MEPGNWRMGACYRLMIYLPYHASNQLTRFPFDAVKVPNSLGNLNGDRYMGTTILTAFVGSPSLVNRDPIGIIYGLVTDRLCHPLSHPPTNNSPFFGVCMKAFTCVLYFGCWKSFAYDNPFPGKSR